jgi:UDPglucose 6-dehydrogenase
MKVALIGLGKVGYSYANVLHKHGFQVIGIENNEKLCKQLQKQAPYQIQQSIDTSISNCDLIIVIVQTPSLPTKKFDLSYVEEAVKNCSFYLKDSVPIIVSSTINVGDIEKLKKHWKNMVYSPLMIAQGQVESDIENPNYVLIGADSSVDEQKTRQMWSKIVSDKVPYIITSTRNMEAIKLTFNFFLCAKISLLNTLSDFCEQYGVDYQVIGEALKRDPRLAGSKWWNEIGLGSGIGFGGPCFPRDIANWSASTNHNSLVKSVLSINSQRIKKSVNLILSLKANPIALLGTTFKPNTPLKIESQSLKILLHLRKAGVTVYPHDPSIDSKADLKHVLSISEIVFVAVPWDEYRNLEPKDFKATQIVVDPWRIYYHKKLPCRHYMFGVGWRK